MKYDVIIGLEIHAELKTNSKMFCSCNNRETSRANSHVCPICLGHPGTLPVPNKKAIEWTIITGTALNCKINRISKFDRKNYFYPDLPKGYQISQFDLPLCYNGYLEIDNRKIKITRIHLEEDTGKSIHSKKDNCTLIDFNRAGTPLMELVTDPVINDAQEAKLFCQKYQQILRYLRVSDANMEKGEMRCEANISLQKPNTWKNNNGIIEATNNHHLSAKVEIKNINSFKAVEKAIEFEIKRQSKILDDKDKVLPETRGWDENKNETVRQRVKENSADYRYFPEPDIPPLEIDQEWLKNISNYIPELPDQKKDRFIREYGLKKDIVEILVNDKALADWTENVISELKAWIEANGDNANRQEKKLANTAVNLISNELLKHLKITNTKIKDIKISAENFAELSCLLYQGKINSTISQKILEIMYKTGEDPSDIIENLGLEQISDQEELEEIIKEIIEKFPKQVEEYKQGKINVIQFLLGQIMAATKGKANPQTARIILKKNL